MTIEIEDNAPDQNETPPPAPRKRAAPRARRKAKAFVSPVATLIAALNFIKPAQSKNGDTKQTHSMMVDHWIAAHDGVLTIATPIDEDLNACPHSLQLLDALGKTGEEVSMTQLSAMLLSISSGDFKAVVPCADPAEMFIPYPDAACAPADDRLKAALAAASTFVLDGAPVAMHAAVLLQAWSVVGTNGHCLIEAQHGIDLPPDLLLPKAAAKVISECDKPIVAFGYGEASVTFHFEDGSWIKSQLYKDRYPAYATIFEGVDFQSWPLPPEFFQAVKMVESFGNGNVYFKDSAVLSNTREFEASTYRLSGLPDNMGFNAKYLLKVEKMAEQVQFVKERRIMFFLSKMANGLHMRGAIMGLDMQEEPAPTNEPYPEHARGHYSENGKRDVANSEYTDDDIPF